MLLYKKLSFYCIFYTVQCSFINFELKEIFHHGAKYHNLFRSLTFDSNEVIAQEKISKTQLTHTIKTTFSNKTISFSSNPRQIQFGKHVPNFLPDITDQNTILSFAKMSSNAYIEPDKDGWLDLGHKHNLNDSYGWKDDGIRAHVFVNKENSAVIIAFKGTSAGIISGDSPTSTKDKLNDNLLFSCCCAHVDSTWHNVCDCYSSGYTCQLNCLEESVQNELDNIYYFAARKIFLLVEDQFPDAQIIVTGHSLGGGLSGLLGLTFGLPTVTFQSPGDLLAARRLHLPASTYPGHKVPYIWHFGHNSDPIYMGECKGVMSSCYLTGYAMESKCHSGNVCVYDTQKNKNWGMDILKHRINVVINEVISQWDGVPSCIPEDEECKDCVLWNYV